jgi:DNA-binding transcriptional MerR regulator
MLSLTFQTVSWPVLVTALLAFGFAPGAVLRLIVLLFPHDDPRRCELLGELYAVPRIERPFWVIEQLEVALLEGLRGRLARRKADDPTPTYSSRNILVLKVIERLLDSGISMQQIRAAVDHLRSRGTDDLAKVTLMSDGVSVYECTSSDEVVDLLQGGQGVFGIALGKIWQEVNGTLDELPPAEQADGPGDELPHPSQ